MRMINARLSYEPPRAPNGGVVMSLKERLSEAGLHWAQFQRLRAELREMGVEHTEQDVIDICVARRRK